MLSVAVLDYAANSCVVRMTVHAYISARMFTCVAASTMAPLSSRRRTIPMCPMLEALIRPVTPSCLGRVGV